jgi:nicotinate phosphoribosyltransferase
MVEMSKEVRRLLNNDRLEHVKIFASSDFDEYKIQQVLNEGAQIDAFGVGTKVGVSADAPYLHIVYKMVRLKDRNVRKLSPGKVTLAGEKQVFRKADDQGQYLEDTIGIREEAVKDAQPLLEKVMENGRITRTHPSLHAIREKCHTGCSALGGHYKDNSSPVPYPVRLSQKLRDIQ